MKTKNVKGLISNIAYVFVPSFIFLLDSEKPIVDFSRSIGLEPVLSFYIILPLSIITAMIILFRFLVKYTKNNFVRLIVIILSALWSVLIAITFELPGAWNHEGIISFHLILIFFVHFFCLLTISMFYLFDTFRTVEYKREQDTN